MSQIKVSLERDGLYGKEYEYSHESFAIAQFNRFTSTDRNYFGAEPITGDGITFRLCKSSVTISEDGNKRFSPIEAPMVEFKMTYNQFAELIGTMNIGEGVPVTLTYKEGKRIPFGDIKSVHNKDIIDEAEKVSELLLNNVKSSISELSDVIKGSKLSIRDKEKIYTLIDKVKMNSSSNMDFFEKKFINKIQDELSSAKTEIESVISGRYALIGEEYLKHKGLLNKEK